MSNKFFHDVSAIVDAAYQKQSPDESLLTIREIAARLDVSYRAVNDRIRTLGITHKGIKRVWSGKGVGTPQIARTYSLADMEAVKNYLFKRQIKTLIQKPEVLEKDRLKTYSRQEICFMLDRADSVVSRWIKSAHMRPQDDGRYTESQFQRLRAISNKTARRRHCGKSATVKPRHIKPTFWQKLTSNLRAWGVI